MKELHTEIEINASAERVWRVLTDFAAYPKWNPFVRRVEDEVSCRSRSGREPLSRAKTGQLSGRRIAIVRGNADIRSTKTRLVVRGGGDGVQQPPVARTSEPAADWA
jgi:hypothetical protein